MEKGTQKCSRNKYPLPNSGREKGCFWKVQLLKLVEIFNCLILQRKALPHLCLPASTPRTSDSFCPGLQWPPDSAVPTQQADSEPGSGERDPGEAMKEVQGGAALTSCPSTTARGCLPCPGSRGSWADQTVLLGSASWQAVPSALRQPNFLLRGPLWA